MHQIDGARKFRTNVLPLSHEETIITAILNDRLISVPSMMELCLDTSPPIIDYEGVST